MKPPTQERVFHMSRVQEKLDRLALAMAYKLEREWPSHYRTLNFAQINLALSVRLCRHKYRAVCYLCAGDTQDDYRWRAEYTLVLPEIARTVLDCLCNVIFMLEDLPNRSDWYLKSGWHEARKEFLLFESEYKDDPEWDNWFRSFKKLLDDGVINFRISPEELSGEQKIPDWPTPGRMADYKIDPLARPPARQFLKYLNDWFYKELSAISHTSFFGIIKTNGLIMMRELSSPQQDLIEQTLVPRHIYLYVSRVVILLLCLLSELQLHFKFDDLGDRLVELWREIYAVVPEGKDLYLHRYHPAWGDL
jgi:hypothetical protein